MSSSRRRALSGCSTQGPRDADRPTVLSLAPTGHVTGGGWPPARVRVQRPGCWRRTRGWARLHTGGSGAVPAAQYSGHVLGRDPVQAQVYLRCPFDRGPRLWERLSGRRQPTRASAQRRLLRQPYRHRPQGPQPRPPTRSAWVQSHPSACRLTSGNTGRGSARSYRAPSQSPVIFRSGQTRRPVEVARSWAVSNGSGRQ
jgi:hypothetical protein